MFGQKYLQMYIVIIIHDKCTRWRTVGFICELGQHFTTAILTSKNVCQFTVYRNLVPSGTLHSPKRKLSHLKFNVFKCYAITTNG